VTGSVILAKQSGLGDGLLFGPYDMSGDVQQLSSLSTPRGVLDFTGIDKSATERQTSTKDGALGMTTFFNPGPAASAAHLVARALPYTDVQLAYLRGTALGSPAFCILGKQTTYDGSRGADGSFTFNVNAVANGFAAEWGDQLTPGPRTDVTATTPASGVDLTDVSTAFGWSAYLHVLAFTGTSVTMTLGDSADNAAFTALSGGAFAAATAIGVQRIAGGPTAVVRRYLRVATSGTFTSATFAAVFVRNRADALL